ncbi:hypothetical protein N0V84_005701 [Fusarium piperis]|uniref:C2H2-type domain-containing protein n=1 Tax=Fusarium piperis TaxID=1435070 RepID=A0A9W8WDA6_9HYPO|nr:hypothetical protein N0V84_005701 [Fusarium piperis]
MSPKGKGHRSRKSKHSSSSNQPQDDEIPIDPSLMNPSFVGYTQAQDYTPAGPSNYAQWQNPSDYQQQQPATVDPNDLWLNQDSSSSAVTHGYYATDPAYQNAHYEELSRELDEQADSSAAAAAAQAQARAQAQDYTCQDCGRICRGLRDFNKHAKTHKKPIRCEADENCKETKAEQRDMNRHYISAHKEFAAWKGLITDPMVCDYPGCGKTFTRRDNLLKHWKKYHEGE